MIPHTFVLNLPSWLSIHRLAPLAPIMLLGSSASAQSVVGVRVVPLRSGSVSGNYAYLLPGGNLRNDVCPADETPVLFYSAAERNLLSDLRACRARQSQPRSIGLDGNHLGTGCSTSDVDHQHFVLRKLRHLGLLAIRRLDTQKTAQQEVVDLQLRVNGRQVATEAQNESNETIGAAESRVDTSTNTW